MNARAPIRVCDIGGWTDTRIAGHGSVFNIAVAPHLQVRLAARLADEVSPGVTLHAENFGDHYAFEPGDAPGRHPHLEASVAEIGIPPGCAVDISITSDAPPGSSTGTSAAAMVALIGALLHLAARAVEPLEVARTAHRIETGRLGMEAGVQDQICAAVGGVNFIEIPRYPQAWVTPVAVPAPALRELDRRLLLVFLGQSHRSSAVHTTVIRRLTEDGEGDVRLEELRRCAVLALEAAIAGDLRTLGDAMIANTEVQRHLEVVSEEAELVMDIAARWGAQGWKVNGAGGPGGSVSLLCGPDPRATSRLTAALCSSDAPLTIVPTSLSATGLQVWDDPEL